METQKGERKKENKNKIKINEKKFQYFNPFELK